MPSQPHNLTPQPPPDRYGLPGKSYPTNDRAAFVVVVEDIPLEAGYKALAPYTAHPSTGGSTGNAEAVLTSESPTKGDGTRQAIRRVYETLPGPWLPDIRRDDRLGFVQVRRRAVRSIPAQYGTISATGQTVYQSRDGSPLVSWEIVETWGNGTGTPSGDGFPNTPFPIRIDDPANDEEKGPLHVARQIVASTGTEPATLTYSAPTVTETTYQYVSPGLRDKIITTYALPGPLRAYEVQDDFTDTLVTETRQLVAHGTASPTITNLCTDFQRVPVNIAADRFVIRTYPSGITSQDPIIEWKPTRFTYPAIQHGISGSVGGGGISFNGGFYLESERPLNTHEKHSTIFTTTQPAGGLTGAGMDNGIVNLLPIRVRFSNLDGSITYNSPVPVLIDAFTTVDTAASQASSPDATTYIAARTAGSYFITQRVARKLSGPDSTHGVWAITTISLPYK